MASAVERFTCTAEAGPEQWGGRGLPVTGGEVGRVRVRGVREDGEGVITLWVSPKG